MNNKNSKQNKLKGIFKLNRDNTKKIKISPRLNNKNKKEALVIADKILSTEFAVDDKDYFSKYIDKIDKKSMLESSQKLGTPQYFLDADSLEKRAAFFMDTFKKNIKNAEFYYAFKCNDLPFIVKTLKNKGFQADVAGIFELELALKLGFEKIIFTSPGKDEKELILSLKNCAKVTINIDNADEFIRLKAIIKKTGFKQKIGISFRINPDSEITKEWSKYGISLKELKKITHKINNEKNISWKGLHFHTSWNETPDNYLKNIKIIGDFLKNNYSKEEMQKLEFLDIGGGYYPEDVGTLTKYTYKGELAKLLEDYSERLGPKKKLGLDRTRFYIDEVEPLEVFSKKIGESLKQNIYPLNKDIKIFFEPGRFLMTHQTSILVKVICVKEAGRCVIVDGGINLVGGPRFDEFAYAPIINLTNPSNKTKKCIIYGPLCDPGDLWGHTYYGKSIKKGDTLAILHQGAYTYCNAWRFIKPIAKYASLKNKQIILAKEEETFDDRYNGCKI